MDRFNPPAVVSSFWLLAEEHDEADLLAEIEHLARQHATPLFQPHLTLLGDVPHAPETLLDVNAKIAVAAKPFSLPIEAIKTGDAYFRSFYALFSISPGLAALRAAAISQFPALDAAFMPHVSLLYGAPPEDAKQASARDVNARLKGRTIRFDRLALTNSGNDVGIGRWTCIDILPLGR